MKIEITRKKKNGESPEKVFAFGGEEAAEKVGKIKTKIEKSVAPSKIDAMIVKGYDQFNGMQVYTTLSGIIGVIVWIVSSSIILGIRNLINPPDYGFGKYSGSGGIFLVGLGLGILCFALILRRCSSAVKRDAEGTGGVKRSKNNTYGSANFDDEIEMQRALAICEPEETDGFLLGQLKVKPKKSKAVYIPKTNSEGWGMVDNKHIIIFGSSGSRKSYSVIQPNILECIKRGDSYVTTDPSGDAYTLTVQKAMDAGYDVIVINANDFSKSDGWDIVGEIIRSDTTEFAAQKAILMAHAIWDNTSLSSGFAKPNEFWDGNNIGLLTFLLQYVALSPSFKEPRNIESVLKVLNDINKSVGEGRDVVYLYDAIVDKMERDFPNDPCIEAYRTFQAGGNNRAQIPNGLQNRLRVLNLASVKNMLSTNDFNLSTVTEKKTAVYLIVPELHSAFNFIPCCFFTCLVQSIKESYSRHGGKIPNETWLLLDEFTNIGKLTDFTKILLNMRKYKIAMVLVAQDKNKLEQVYKDEANSIISNCATNIILKVHPGDKNTSEYVSKMLGEYTIIQGSVRHGGNSIGILSGDMTPQFQKGEGKRNLMTPEEVTNLDSDKMIVVMTPTTGTSLKVVLDKYRFADMSPEFEYCRTHEHRPEDHVPKRGVIEDPTYKLIRETVLMGSTGEGAMDDPAQPPPAQVTVEPGESVGSSLGQLDEVISTPVATVAQAESSVPVQTESVENKAAPEKSPEPTPSVKPQASAPNSTPAPAGEGDFSVYDSEPETADKKEESFDDWSDFGGKDINNEWDMDEIDDEDFD